MKLDKQKLNGYWFKANKETFYALVEAGYRPSQENLHSISTRTDVFLYADNQEIRWYETHSKVWREQNPNEQAFHHQGEFYDDELDFGFTEVARIPITKEQEKAILNKADKWQAISDYIDSRPAEQKEGALLMLERLKPEMERLQAQVDELESKKLKNTGKRHRCADALHLLAEDTNLLIEYYTPEQTWHKGSFYVIDKADRDDTKAVRIKKNGKVIWSTMQAEKETDPLAKIKAQYAEAKEAEKNGGPIVKFFTRPFPSHKWQEIPFEAFLKEPVYHSGKKPENMELRFYEIAFEKVLETSYRDGEFVECEFSKHENFQDAITGPLVAYAKTDDECEFVNGLDGKWYEYCRLPKGTEIKNEWLKEVEK